MNEIIQKNRGNVEDKNIEKLNKQFQKILGRDANGTEIRLFPYLSICLLDQKIERNKINFDEWKYLEDYEEKGLIIINSDNKIGCTKEFWNFMTEILYDRYVCEISLN